MMQSTMQDLPLNVGMIFRHGRALHGKSEVVTFEGASSQHASFADVSDRVDRLAAALVELGIESGDRVGTFMWNTQQHLEAYFSVPLIGAVLPWDGEAVGEIEARGSWITASYFGCLLYTSPSPRD